MGIRVYKPYSKGRRGMTGHDFAEITKSEPEKALTKGSSKSGGRGNTGRVTVRFVIGRDGAVSNVSNGGSDLPDSNVVNCVVKAFYGLSFPKPEGGIVTVQYPIMLQPG